MNSNKISNYVKENIGFSVIIKQDAKEADIIKLKKRLDASEYVKSTKFISKDEAADELQKELGEDFTEFIGYNPLSSSIDVKLYADYTNIDSINVIQQNLNKYGNIIKEVFYQKNLVSIVNHNVKRISLFILGLSFLLFIISWTLINNTIRLSVYSKRFIIKTMHLVGATNSFIRRPFLNSSSLTGIIGSFIAISALALIVHFTQEEFEGAVNFTQIDVLLVLFSILVLLGIIITRVSAYFAVNKYINLKSDELYYN
jgi:cell division transport system permease protein